MKQMKNCVVAKEDILNLIDRKIREGKEVVAPVKQENQAKLVVV
ncbi:unnamed protein product [marine sediment metagenome]|uniref:Uncharacterized protein n=1 Tax=marine sediment metagenome TaxID=412755 RepID=X1PFN3_9ZZZZ